MTTDMSSPSRKIAARAYLQTAAQLRTVIADLQLDPGARLPSERELAQQLGVSRPTLREALIVLELQDEVEIRIGSGIYVKNNAVHTASAGQRDNTSAGRVVNARAGQTGEIGSGRVDNANAEEPANTGASNAHGMDSPQADQPVTDPPVNTRLALTQDISLADPDSTPDAHAALMLHSIAEDSPKEVNQMRYFLESAVAAEAARFMSADLRKTLRKSLTDMQTAMAQSDLSTNARMADADRLFHTTLAQSSDNQLVIQTITSLFDQRYRPIARTMHRHFDDQQAWLAAMQEHEQICQAIEERDPLQAQAAMQRHLTRAHQRLMTIIG